MKHCNEPTTRIDQVKIIPFIPPKKEGPPKTWEEQLARVFKEKPWETERICSSLYWPFSMLPTDILQKRVFDDVRFLKEYTPSGFQWCVEQIEEKYKKLFCTEAEIVPVSGSPEGGAK